MKQKKIYFLKGLPCSGKTTWALKNIDEKTVRVSRDDLRNMRGKYWVPQQEKLITEWENDIIKNALKYGYNVIVDATNLSSSRNYDKFKKIEKAGEFEEGELIYEDVFFHVDLQKAIERDNARENSVGKDTIIRMYKKYMAPRQMKSNLPSSIIFDIDGTLAKRKDRGVYEWDKVENDEINDSMKDLYISYFNKGYKILLVSGRSQACMDMTKQWLIKNGMALPHMIFMKSHDSREKSYIFKKFTYIYNILDRYDVEFVVDDSEKDINMWKSLGLKTINPVFE